jgi:NADH-quinone oxidoreductase subunit H
MDQLMGFAWTFILPMALVNIVAAGIAHFLPAGLESWTACAVLILLPAFLLARRLREGKKYGMRSYRFAD